MGRTAALQDASRVMAPSDSRQPLGVRPSPPLFRRSVVSGEILAEARIEEDFNPDSLTLAQVAMKLEERFNVLLPKEN